MSYRDQNGHWVDPSSSAANYAQAVGDYRCLTHPGGVYDERYTHDGAMCDVGRREAAGIPGETVRIVRLPHCPGIPEYAESGSSGFDLRAAKAGMLYPEKRILIPTGLRMEIPEGFEGQIRSRSGLAFRHGIMALHGTIDSSFRGEVMVLLFNHGMIPWSWEAGDRIAQMVIAPVQRVGFEEVDNLSPTERGEGGFGSTGI